jgi:hypothetical protein|tara:strand:- start:9382 stop:9657 length:276 start_codon:yes stop_codon:yes gene_type:complete
MARKKAKAKSKKATKVGSFLDKVKVLPSKALKLVSNLWGKVKDRALCMDCWASLGSLGLGVAMLWGCLDMETISGILLIGMSIYLFRNDYH